MMSTAESWFRDPVNRHLLKQVGIVGAELDGRQDPTVSADGGAAAVIANFLSLEDEAGALPLLQAQLTAMHEIAMLSLSRTAANIAAGTSHHRNVWDAVRATTAFMRQLDAFAKLSAAVKARAKAEGRAAPRRLPAKLPKAVVAEVSAEVRAARKARDEAWERANAGGAKKNETDGMTDEQIQVRLAYYEEEIASAGGEPTRASLYERIAELEKEAAGLRGTAQGAHASDTS